VILRGTGFGLFVDDKSGHFDDSLSYVSALLGINIFNKLYGTWNGFYNQLLIMVLHGNKNKIKIPCQQITAQK
jgi:hypothetical protein